MGRHTVFFMIFTVFASVAVQKSNGALLNNLVTQWTDTTRLAIARYSVPSQIASRYFALVNLAIYNALGRKTTYSYSASYRAAAAHYAAHYVLSHEFPALQSPTFDGQLKLAIDALKLSSPTRASAAKFGRSYVVKLLKARINDGSQVWANFVPAPSNGPDGAYQYAPNQTFVVYPQLGSTRTFVIGKIQKFDTEGGPYELDSPAYAANLAEVKELGQDTSATREAYDTDTARFWALTAGTSTTAGQAFEIAKAVLPASTSVLRTARVFAAVAVAQYDASIATYGFKYKYRFWRPVTAIRRTDPTWTPLLSTPTHPEYPGGHATTLGSTFAVLAKALNVDVYDTIPSYSVSSEGNTIPPRVYTSLGDALLEAGDSRVFGGIHFRKAVDDGNIIGQAIGEVVWKRNLIGIV